MAEREGFEPPIALRLCLISSQVHSTGLCHLSAFSFILTSRLAKCQILFHQGLPSAGYSSAHYQLTGKYTSVAMPTRTMALARANPLWILTGQRAAGV